MKTIQRLKNKSLLAKILFWSGEIIGAIALFFILIFIGAHVFEELKAGLIAFKEETKLLVFFFFLLGSAAGLIISLFRNRFGALIIIFSIISAILTWGFTDGNILILLFPLFSGILLLFSAYQNEDNTKD